MANKKTTLNDILERIVKIETRLEEISPIAKRKLPSKKEQIAQIEAEIKIWSQKFPTIDIEFELAKMLDWLKATNKRKKDYRAFFRNWLRKSTNTVGNEPVRHNHILIAVLAIKQVVKMKYLILKICHFFARNATT